MRWNLAVVAAALALAAPAHADIAFRGDSLTAIPTYEWLVCKPVGNDTVYIKIDFGGGDAESVDALTVQHVLPYEVVTRAEQYNQQVALNAYPTAQNGYTITWKGIHIRDFYDAKGVSAGEETKVKMVAVLQLVKGRVIHDARTHVWTYQETIFELGEDPLPTDKPAGIMILKTTCHATKYQGYQSKPELVRR